MMHCRNCKFKIEKSFLKFENFPLANNLKNKVAEDEVKFDLEIFFCKICFLVQANMVEIPEKIFTRDYPYQSSTSTKFLSHCKKYSDELIADYKLNTKSYVIEIACNDGYMLEFFKNRMIPHLGIEPTDTVKIANKKGINAIKEFFNSKLAKKLSKEKIKADCLIGNNVLAHVPDIYDFLKGVKILLKENGVAIFEFPHILKLIKKNLFDTIYHEHFSYLSILFLLKITNSLKLKIFKIKKTSIHGGSLRIFIAHEKSKIKLTKSVDNVLQEELNNGLDKFKTYINFSNRIISYKLEVVNFLKKLRGKIVLGYGAAAKATVLINLLNLNNQQIQFIYDKSKSKHNKFIPGSNIQIKDSKELLNINFDYLIVFPWNIKKEITNDLKKIKNKDYKLLFLMPKLSIVKIK